MTVHVVTMVPSQMPSSEAELTASMEIVRLREVLRENGGQPVLPILIGDATLFESLALGYVVGPFDVLLTSHTSISAYREAIKTPEYQKLAGKQKVLTFGFTNEKIYLKFILPALRKLHSKFRDDTDVDKRIFVETGEKVDYNLYQTGGASGLKRYKQRVAIHPNRTVYMIDIWTWEGSPIGRTNETEYKKKWQTLLFEKDVETLYSGRIISLDGGPKSFQEIAIYKFPSRETFVEMIESAYYIDLVYLRFKFNLDQFVQLCLPIY